LFDARGPGLSGQDSFPVFIVCSRESQDGMDTTANDTFAEQFFVRLDARLTSLLKR